MTEPIYDDPNKCVKSNPELGPCMCPECMESLKKDTSAYIKKGVVLTDADLVTPNPEHRVAWFFTCPVCKKNNVADYNPRCPDCGEIVILRSKTVMNFLQSHINRK